jgi:hypothetical protein
MVMLVVILMVLIVDKMTLCAQQTMMTEFAMELTSPILGEITELSHYLREV